MPSLQSKFWRHGATHPSAVSQYSPGAQSTSIGTCVQPLDAQPSCVQAMPSSHDGGVPGTQRPIKQSSIPLHGLPSSHDGSFVQPGPPSPPSVPASGPGAGSRSMSRSNEQAAARTPNPTATAAPQRTLESDPRTSIRLQNSI